MAYRDDLEAAHASNKLLREELEQLKKKPVKKKEPWKMKNSTKDSLFVVGIIAIVVAYLMSAGVFYKVWEDPNPRGEVDMGAVLMATIWPVALPCKGGAWIYKKITAPKKAKIASPDFIFPMLAER